MKAKTLLAILGKQLGVKPAGWEEVAPTHMTLGDVDSPETLKRYQDGKRAYKAAIREAPDGDVRNLRTEVNRIDQQSIDRIKEDTSAMLIDRKTKMLVICLQHQVLSRTQKRIDREFIFEWLEQIVRKTHP